MSGFVAPIRSGSIGSTYLSQPVRIVLSDTEPK